MSSNIHKSFSAAIAVNSSISLGWYTAPVGLFGELITMALVLSVIAALVASNIWVIIVSSNRDVNWNSSD